MKVKDRIKLLVIPSSYPAYASEISGVFVLDYLRSVTDHCEITVLNANVKGGGKQVEEVTLFGFRTIILSVGRIPWLPFSKMLAYLAMIIKGAGLEAIKDREFDLIHVHGSTMHGLLAARIAKKRNIPFVVTEHTGPFSKISGNPIFYTFSKRNIEKANCLLTVSNDLLNQIKNSGIRPKKSIVTFNPVATDVFVPKLDKQPSYTFIFVGRYEPYKGAMRVLKAFDRLPKEAHLWKLKLIGGGPEKEEMTAYVSKHGLQQRVEILGQLDKPEIAAHLGNAAVFVFPSEHETFGIVIAEAMACGLPVIVGDRTAPKEFVGKDHGILVNPTSVDEICEAMRKMTGYHGQFDPNVIRNHVVNKFSFSNFGTSMVNIYKSTID